eukprot:4171416-Amphidinium_carterae.1
MQASERTQHNTCGAQPKSGMAAFLGSARSSVHAHGIEIHIVRAEGATNRILRARDIYGSRQKCIMT